MAKKKSGEETFKGLTEAELAEKVAAQRRKLEATAADDFQSVIEKAKDTVTAQISGKPLRDNDSRGKMYVERSQTIEKREAENIARINPRAVSFEGIVDAQDFLHLDYFVKGIAAARSIGRINPQLGDYFGTGFICAPGMVMTNNHVIQSPDMARFLDIGFETFDGEVHLERCDLDPDRFFFTSPIDELDCTIVAMAEEKGAGLTEKLGWHGLKSEQGKIALGRPTAIIQYPKGLGKRLIIHNSVLVEIDDLDAPGEKLSQKVLWYTSDTNRGSSGSPVFNRHFEVIALHHAGVPVKKDGKYVDRNGNTIEDADFDANPERAVYSANEGIRASRISMQLKKQSYRGKAHQARRRDEILEAWEDPDGGQAAVLQNMRERVMLSPKARTGTPPILESSGVGHRGADGALFEEIVRRLQEGRMRIEFL